MLRLFILVAFSAASVKSDGYYKVTGPRVIRPNSEYHAAVSMQATSLPTTVNVALLGQSYDGRPYRSEGIVTVSPYATRIVRLEVGDIRPGDYTLHVEGNGGASFQVSRRLQYVPKSYSVFVLTDRAVYQPGSKIFFRAIVLNPELKPAGEVRNEPFDIHISDGDGNKVKEWRSFEPRGVFTGELELSKNPVLGLWNISVTIHGQNYNKTIEVARYIMPKFLIDIQAPKHITFGEKILTAHIETKYKYGRKVKGNATVTVYPTYNSGVLQPIFQNPVRKVVPIDGSVTVNFDIEKDLNLNDEYERTVIVDVIIEEALTWRRQNNSVPVHIHKYDYKMEIIKTADYYKPGLKYTAFIKVTNHDGTPIANDRRNVTVRYGYSRVDEIYVVENYKLDNNGVVTLELHTPRNSTNETALRIEAEYYGLKERMPPVPAAVSFSNTFLQATIETSRPRINELVEIFVNCTEPLKYINYELIAKGDVIIANSFQVNDKNEYRFHFTATHAMIPISHLLVNYVRSDGELVADSLDIEVEGILQNFVDIQINTFEARPGTDIDMTIGAKPNSYVSLLAVDKNSANLRSGYDITQNDVMKELISYDVSHISPYAAIMKDDKSHFFWKQGASNPHDTYHDSGALVITNSYVNNFRPTLEDIYVRPPSYGSSTVKPDIGIGLSFPSVTRPPLEGPYAFSRIPRPVWDIPRVYLNEEVAPTWLFTNFSSRFDGKTSISRKIPDTLNTWVITGFSLDPINGLGVSTNPKEIKVTKPLIITTDLPRAVKKGEIVAVPIVVHNNMDQNLNIEITLHNPQQRFEFAEESNAVNATRKIELYRRKRINVPKNSRSSTSFMILALKLGNAEIKITGNGGNVKETLLTELSIVPEGEKEYYTKTLLINLRNNLNFKSNITIDIPKNFVQGSVKIEASVVGDLLGPTMINLDDLIHLPTGCGEQNLVHFVPNLIILDYLRNSGQLTPVIEKKAILNLERSYQQQLMYKRPDGSFMVFNKRDTEGSVWVTAYVSMAFAHAKSYIYIDENIIDASLKWLMQHQGINGSFVETGNAVHEKLQNKNGKSLAMTAYTLQAFIENRQHSNYLNVINKGLDYIAKYLEEEEDTYTIALCTYVLHVSNHNLKERFFDLLDAKAKIGKNKKWWAQDIVQNETDNPWNHLPKSIDIETTSYALLSFLEENLLDDAVPVLEWLIEQQNNLGGFTSSQDTVIGLQALYQVSLKLTSKGSMQIDYAFREREKTGFTINQNSAMIVQKMEIPNDVRLVNVTANGGGLALFRISYEYNVNVTGPWPLFTLDPQVDKNSDENHLQISICSAFVSKNLSESGQSNMAVMEVNLPSGFTADIDALPSLEVSQNVQKVETSNSDATVILYFNNLTQTEYCPTVSAYKTHKVAKQKPVPVVIYDYYDSSRRARIFYTGRTITLCDICEDEDCGDICTSSPNRRLPGDFNGDRSSALKIHFSWSSASLLLFCFYK